MRELQYAGLVEIQKQGCGKPNRIFPKSYEAVSNTDFKKSGMVRRRAENRTHEVRKSLLRSTKTGRYIEIQRLKRLIYILSIPILSELFSAGFSLWKPRIGKEWGKEQNGTTRNFAV